MLRIRTSASARKTAGDESSVLAEERNNLPSAFCGSFSPRPGAAAAQDEALGEKHFNGETPVKLVIKKRVRFAP